MSWEAVTEEILALKKGGLTADQYTRFKSTLKRLTKTLEESAADPASFSTDTGRHLLAPLFTDEKLAVIAELAIDRVARALKGEALEPLPAIGKKKQKKPKVEEPVGDADSEADTDDTEDDEDSPAEDDTEDDMAQQPQNDEQFEDDELPPEEEEVVQQPRPRRQAIPVQTVYVQAPAPGSSRRRRTQAQPAAPQRRTLDSLLPTPEKLRIFVRLENGQRELVNDYSLDDLGDMKVKEFITAYVDPEYGNESGTTKYEAYKVDPRTDRELPPVHEFTVHSRNPPQSSNDPFSTIHRAVDLMNTLKASTTQAEPPNPLLQAAQQKAVAGGDMMSLMMLMMMEKSMAPKASNDGELLKMVLERLDKIEGRRPNSPSPDFGPPAPPPMWSMPPMPMPPPPPPAAESKLLDIALAKLVNPPSFVDQLKEMVTLQQLMGGGQQNTLLTQLVHEVAALKGAPAAGRVSGLEEAVATFEKVGTMVKALAPQVGGGGESAGIGSALQNIITPKLGQALGDALAGGIEKQKAQQQGAQAPAAQGTAPAAPAAPAARDPNKPPSPPPAAVLEAVRAAQVAQTHEVRVERFLDIVQTMFTSADPYYSAKLQPALEGLNQAEKGVEFLTPARVTAFFLAADTVGQHATPEFVDDALVALAKRFGVATPPATLTQTKGLWLIDARGALVWKAGAPPVVLLDGSIAQAVAQPPAPPPAPAPSPQPAPQLVANTVEAIEPTVDIIEAPASPPIPLTQEVKDTGKVLEFISNEPRPTVPARAP